MSNYTKTTDFEAKDSLPTGDSGKIIRGAEFETEFDAISTAIATKADTAGPTFTGTLTFETISDGTIGVTAFVDEDDMSSDSATLVPTQQSVKAYVDSQVTAQDLDFQADTGGALSIDLDSESLTFTGGTGIDTSGSGNAVTFAIDSTVATLTGTQTLTNKTLTAPTISGDLTTDGTIDGRDVATDGTKLDGIEASADVTDTANVTAAGALMDSEVTNLAQVKAFDSADYATAAQGTTADSAMQDLVDDTTPQLGGDLASNGNDILFADNDKAIFGAGSDLQIYHNGSRSVITDQGTGPLRISATNLEFKNADDTKLYANAIDGGAFNIYYDNAKKLETTSTGIDVTGGIAATDDSTFTAASGDIYVTASTPTGAARSGFRVDETANNGFEMAHDNADNAFFISRRSGSSTVVDALKIDRSTGDFSLFEDTGTTAKLFWDASAERLGIGNSSPSTALDVTGTVTADGLTVDGSATIQSTSSPAISVIDTTNNAEARLQAFNSTATVGTQSNHSFSIETNDTNRALFATNGDISFYEDTGTTAKLFWDASAEVLEVNKISALGDQNTKLDLNVANTARVFTGGLERMRIDSSGQVGIGTNSPASPLHVDSNANGNIIHANGGANAWDFILKGTNDGDVNSVLYELGMYRDDGATNPNTVLKFGRGTGTQNGFFAIDQNGSEAMRIDSSGNLLVGTTNTLPGVGNTVAGISLYNDGRIFASKSANTTMSLNRSTSDGAIAEFRKDGTTVGSISTFGGNLQISPNTTFGVDAPSDIFLDSAGVTTFKTNGTENARIDSSGNLLVGKTSDDNTTTGMVVGGNGFTKIVRTSGTANVNTVLSLNRLVTDGEILRLQKDGTNVGSISVLSNRLYIGSGDTGIKFSGADDLISPIDASDGTGRDAAIDLGSSSARFKDLYLSGGAYLGGTGSANLLDDYEEGTFTITLRDATSGGNTSSTTANGSYTKVGRLVTCSLNGALSNIDTTGMTGANTLYMDLPFTKDVTVEDLGVMVYDSLDTGSLNASIQNVVPETVSGSSNVLQFRTYGDNIGDNLLKVQDITSGTTDFIRLTITYQAA